jgi:hypothetical protein
MLILFENKKVEEKVWRGARTASPVYPALHAQLEMPDVAAGDDPDPDTSKRALEV